MAAMRKSNSKIKVIEFINLSFALMGFIRLEKKRYSQRIHSKNQIIQELSYVSTIPSTTLNTTLDFRTPSKGFCVYYGIMSDYPDTMEYPNAYEIDCNGELLLIMPLINKEALLVLLHSRSKQDDPNAWSYSCTVDGEIVVDKRVVSPTSFFVAII